MCDITQVPSNVDLLTFHPKQNPSSKRLQTNTAGENKKSKRGKKLLHLLKFQGDHNEAATEANHSHVEDSPPDQDLKFVHDTSPSLSDLQLKDLSLSTSENDSSGNATSDSFKTKWTSSMKTHANLAPSQSLSDVSEETSFDHSPDVIVAEGNLGRKIRVKNYSPPPETIAEKNSGRETKKSEAVGIIRPSKHHLTRTNHDTIARECKSSLARHEHDKHDPSSDSSFSPNQDFSFSPKREVFGQILELDNEDDQPISEHTSQPAENSGKKSTISNLHMPTISYKGKMF